MKHFIRTSKVSHKHHVGYDSHLLLVIALLLEGPANEEIQTALDRSYASRVETTRLALTQRLMDHEALDERLFFGAQLGRCGRFRRAGCKPMAGTYEYSRADIPP